ncbi:MAG: adenosylcobinamide amidohydrolase [Candidatus Bathyarchaeia archaeon]|jgi:adenosylcobinamide amidohydrolase
MKYELTKFQEKRLKFELDPLDVKVVYHSYDDVELNTLLVSFVEKRKVLSTLDGLKKVNHIANTFVPLGLSKEVMTIKGYQKFQKNLPSTLGINASEITVMSTGVNMEKLAVSEKSYADYHVCCIATAGARNNALRTGVDEGKWIENNDNFEIALGTINIILLTNVVLTEGALARAIMTATEAKTAALQDLDYKSSSSPQIQATGTGTDNMVVVSGADSRNIIHHTGGHTKIGELIGVAAKTAVTDALKKHDN